TVQRMYFGDWSVDNMPEDDGQPGGRPGRGGPRGSSVRPSGRDSREGRAPQGERRRSESGAGAAPAQAQGQAQGQGNEGDRRRRRRRSRRPGSDSPQG
ncbi:MAG: hypothetical protein Q4C67_11375, partial [Deinococcus sp.]|nr:hypothetical protein [Deinococcus sp.]